MDETFILKALQEVGEDKVASVKVIKNKFTGEPASYGFINFSTDHYALMAMHKLNGKVIPNTSPVSMVTSSNWFISTRGRYLRILHFKSFFYRPNIQHYNF